MKYQYQTETYCPECGNESKECECKKRKDKKGKEKDRDKKALRDNRKYA